MLELESARAVGLDVCEGIYFDFDHLLDGAVERGGRERGGGGLELYGGGGGGGGLLAELTFFQFSHLLTTSFSSSVLNLSAKIQYPSNANSPFEFAPLSAHLSKSRGVMSPDFPRKTLDLDRFSWRLFRTFTRSLEWEGGQPQRRSIIRESSSLGMSPIETSTKRLRKAWGVGGGGGEAGGVSLRM